VAASAPAKVFGEDAFAPEFASFPDADANNVQSVASVPLLTMKLTGELMVLTPVTSIAFAVMLCGPLESVAVLSEKVQLVTPEAVANVPVSIETCTELRLPEAVPETMIVPETVAPAAGESMATIDCSAAMLMLKEALAD
jgi:hypothetical protein